ncbi:MAG: oxidoreductase [Cellulosilyticum sp.]|nr:oxidoreductase [Cellulosilyticum sp.]
MKKNNLFPNTVHYCSPAHGGWGVVRVGMLVPESYQLFVCPSACGRHGALGAIEHGNKGRLSYLYIDEADIVSGSYENLILEGVEVLLEALEEQPKAMFIFVSCLDDLLGTDHVAILDVLNNKYPIKFQVGHMNPITNDSKTPPPVTLQRSIYELVEGKGEKAEALNLLGNFVPLDENNELFDVLSQLGVTEVKHISQQKTFKAFEEMGESKYNLVLRPEAKVAAEDMKRRHKINHRFLPVSYDMEIVAEQYKEIIELINKDVNIDLTKVQEETRAQIEKAREVIGDFPIVIGHSAVCRPYNLAKALISYGFNVQRVYAEEVAAFEKESYEWLKENAPGVEIISATNHNRINRVEEEQDCIAIGYNAAYIEKSKHVVDLIQDEYMFGYNGIVKLMEKMTQCYLEPMALKEMIEKYGLVV